MTPVHTNRDRETWPQLAEFSAIVFELMRTGTRWTILVKLPVAFSGGMTLN